MSTEREMGAAASGVPPSLLKRWDRWREKQGLPLLPYSDWRMTDWVDRKAALIEDGTVASKRHEGVCQMCGQLHIRYLHFVKHPQLPALELRVGSECVVPMLAAHERAQAERAAGEMRRAAVRARAEAIRAAKRAREAAEHREAAERREREARAAAERREREAVAQREREAIEQRVTAERRASRAARTAASRDNGYAWLAEWWASDHYKAREAGIAARVREARAARK